MKVRDSKTYGKYLQKLIRKKDQKVALLIARPDFQKDACSMRKKWNVPELGFRNMKEWDRWQSNILNLQDKYFDEKIPKNRIRFNELRTQNYTQYLEFKKNFNLQAPWNSFNNDIASLVNKYKLHPKWKEGIQNYLYYNDTKIFKMFIGIVIHYENDKQTGATKLLLELDEDTTLEDMKAFWPSVKYHQSRLSYKKRQKNQPIKNLDLYKKAYELRQKGKTYKQIANFLNKNALKKKKDNPYEYNEISDFIKKFKKLTGSN